MSTITETLIEEARFQVALLLTGLFTGLLAFVYLGEIPSLSLGYNIRGLMWAILFLTIGIQPTVFLVSNNVRVRIVSVFMIVTFGAFLLVFFSSRVSRGLVGVIVNQHMQHVLMAGAGLSGSIAFTAFLSDVKSKMLYTDIVLMGSLAVYASSYLSLSLIRTRNSEILVLIASVLMLAVLTIGSLFREASASSNSGRPPA